MKVKLSNEQYDVLKWVGGILLPALAAFYAGLAVLWSLPKGVEVSGSLGLIAALLGTLINRASKNYEGEVTPELGEH